MLVETKQALIEHLSQFVTAQRLERLETVLEQRTRYISVVLEDLYQFHNANAVIRSCECFGVQDLHVIENQNTFDYNPQVNMGASQWVSLHRHNQPEADNTRLCLSTLKQQGYRLVAMTLHPDSIPLQALDLEQKVALCFGTEEEGLSQTAHRLADTFVQIPMVGFTQSFNISVTVALSLFDLTTKLRTSQQPWPLNPNEKQDLRIAWLTEMIKGSDIIIDTFMKIIYE